MKILKRILLGIAALIVIILVVALFIKRDFAVERQVVINKPNQQVFDYVKYLQNQPKYSKWASMDPNMQTEFKGTDATPGFVYSWNSNKSDVGSGEQTIRSITDGKEINYDLHFIKPFESRADAYMNTESVGTNQTKVRWGFKSRMNYPMNVMLLFMDMDKSVGGDFQTGLNNLKNIMEKQ